MKLTFFVNGHELSLERLFTALESRLGFPSNAEEVTSFSGFIEIEGHPAPIPIFEAEIECFEITNFDHYAPDSVPVPRKEES